MVAISTGAPFARWAAPAPPIAIAALRVAIASLLLFGADWRAGGDALAGDGLALLGAASASAYLVVGRRLRAALPLLPYLGCVNAIAAVLLLATTGVLGTPIAHLPAHSYVACAGAAVFGSLVGHSLLN